MVIIAGHVVVAVERRDAYVEAHADLVRRAREADGCLHVAITADTVAPDRVQLVEVWRDAAALDHWRATCDAPDAGEPLEVVVARYDATDGGPLF
jgi:quinol monooxygenase YgiN